MYKLDFGDYVNENYGMTDNEFQLLSNRDKSEIRNEYKKYLEEEDNE